ncbi:MAG: hypothetical protein ABSB83_04860 [Methanomassiliicoccales archaeon]|jgi:hypothetical protein
MSIKIDKTEGENTFQAAHSLKEISVGEILGEGGKKNEHHGIRAAILAYVRQNPDGVTPRMVSEAIGVDYHRSYMILKELCTAREIYSRKVGGIKTDLYYPNGKLIHKYLQQSIDLGDQTFRVSFHEGRRGARIQIQERRYTLLEGEKVEGSVFVDADKAENLVNFLQDILMRFQQVDRYGKSKGDIQ